MSNTAQDEVPQRDEGNSLATIADRVREIIEAAERTAARIGEEAQAEAAQLRAGASAEAESLRGEAERLQADAQRLREDAATTTRDEVDRVREAISGLARRVDAMEGDLAALFHSFCAGADRLRGDLALLEGELGEYMSVPAPGPAPDDADIDHAWRAALGPEFSPASDHNGQ
jgi:chromosome segregation ATPase